MLSRGIQDEPSAILILSASLLILCVPQQRSDIYRTRQRPRQTKHQGRRSPNRPIEAVPLE